MARVKGCINETCIAKKKRITYKDSDDYCSKCGNSLVYVCKKCYTQLPNDSKKYCERCLAEKQDHKDRNLKKVSIIAGGTLSLGVLVLKKGKDIIKHIPRVK